MENLLAKIVDSYKISNISKVERVEMGYLSENHFLTDIEGKKYFLKKYRSKYSYDDVNYTHQVKRYFHNGGVPVVLPVTNSSGGTVLVFDDEIYSLFPFVIGNIVRRKERTSEMNEEVGRMLGKIHQLGVQSDLSVRHSFKWTSSDHFRNIAEQILGLIKVKNEKDEFDEVARELLMLQLQLVPVADEIMTRVELDSECLIHGDYNGSNLFFDNEGLVSYVFDFEMTGHSSRAFELARTVDHMCLETEFGDSDFRIATDFMKGYQEAFPITFEEFKSGFDIFYSKQILSLWVLTEHYLNGNMRVDVFAGKLLSKLRYYKDRHLETLDRIYCG